MDRRGFLLGMGAASLVACSKPERDLLEPFEGVDVPLQPGPVIEPPIGTIPGTSAPASTVEITPMDALRNSVPAEHHPGLSFTAAANVPTVTVEEVPGDGVAAWTFANPVASGGGLVFLVDDYNGVSHYRVLLPTRPNGTFGWVSIDSVDLLRHNFAIRVELEEFRLTVFDHEENVLETEVGVARDNAPTPTGLYYTTELLRPPTPDTAYGAYAYGLSGFSDTFVTFAGGPGQLGIHGTNDPATLGTNVSSGCIRLHNDAITKMVEEIKVPIGVPVEVI